MKARILIVEDNADERFLEKSILEKAGYEVLESDNAKSGIDLALKEKPDLILMDIRLPYKTKGIGAAKIIRDHEATRDIPIIFITAHRVFKDTKEIKNIKKSGFISKSADQTAFLKYIETFLEK